MVAENKMEGARGSAYRGRVGPVLVPVPALAVQACIHSSNGSDNDPAPADPMVGAESLCTETTNAAHTACQFEVDDDYWIAIGNCKNLSDAGDRETCADEANEEREEALQECAGQRDARAGVCLALGEGPYDPVIDPAQFLDRDGIIANPNPYFPLTPGLILVYESEEETVTVTVTDETREILGVTTVVVNDVVSGDGEIVEETDDWFAQDINGNVWYFGEIARNFEDGELVDIEGSWKAGVDGAKPGIVMYAVPVVGDVYRQEFFLGDAEDMGEVLSVTASATVPAASCVGNCVQTLDFSPLEPDVEEHKYYAMGIGPILEIDQETGERVELVEIVMP